MSSEEKQYLTHVIADGFRRFMGWCPNARTMQNGPGINAPPSAGTLAVPQAGSPGQAGPRDRYRHTQLGTIQIAASIIAIVIIGLSMIFFEFFLPSVLIIAVLLIALVLFGSLTVSVTGAELVVRFGAVGIITKRFHLDSMVAVTQVKNSWYYGWGIRWTPSGPLYNVAGFDAVEVELANGKKFRVGTDEPEELIRAIRSAANLPA